MSTSIQTQCPGCKQWRWVIKYNKNARPNFTGYCKACYLKHAVSGNKLPQFRRGYSIDTRDYKYVTISQIENPELRELCRRSVENRSRGKRRSGMIYEHHMLMIKKLGRPLLPGEIVHHKDGNPVNNDIDNLILTNQRDHIRGYNELLFRVKELESLLNK